MAFPGQYVLQNVRIIDPVNAIDAIGAIGIDNGVFTLPAAIPHACKINLAGFIAAPGFIDMHVHLRDPGQSQKEDLATGTQAAAAGGFTTVVAMPNTNPPIDNSGILSDLYGRIRQHARVRVLQTATLSIQRQGRLLTDFKALKAAGAVALTDDGSCLQDSALMRRAFHAAREAGLPIIDHCEIAAISGAGIISDSAISRLLGVSGIAATAEDVVVARDILLAKEFNHPVHLQHISSSGSCALLLWAHQHHIPVSAEVTPHHLCLNDTAFLEYKSNAKMNPPLRRECDRQHILAALRQGHIDVIASDHAPHTQEEKNRGFQQAPFGIIGLESTVPLCLTLLVHGGILNLMQLVAKFTSVPRKILNLPYGSMTPGAPADLTLLDLQGHHTISLSHSRSRSRNSPFHNWECRGMVAGTILNGQWVFSKIPEIDVAVF